MLELELELECNAAPYFFHSFIHRRPQFSDNVCRETNRSNLSAQLKHGKGARSRRTNASIQGHDHAEEKRRNLARRLCRFVQDSNQ